MLSLDENAKVLSGFGLTHNQAKVYIAIAKLGVASVSQISRASKVRREDVYRMLPKLEKMGLIEKILGKPTKIKATPVEEALSVLIKREKDLAKKRLNTLVTRKDEFLKHFKAYEMKPIAERAHFALISEREGIINKELVMAKEAERELDVISSRDKLLHIFNGYVEQFKEAMRRGVRIRLILDLDEHADSTFRAIERYNSSGACLDVRFTDQPSTHCVIRDYEEALIATSKLPTIGETPYLWTDDDNLIELLQRNFEGIWNASVDVKVIQTEAVTEKLTRFLESLRPTNHVMLLYNSLEAKYNVLFNYLRIGLEKGEAVVYITSEENPSRIREAMKSCGIEVEKYEKTDTLSILRYSDFYIIEGEFDALTTIGLIRKMYTEAMTKGFTGWRAAGEMAFFFEHNLIEKLIEYESALHGVFDIPIIGICAYNANMIIKANNSIDLYNELLKAHRKVLFSGVDKKLGRVEIRQG